MSGCQNYGPFLGTLFQYGTKYLGYPKRDHNFDNHPYWDVAFKLLLWLDLKVQPSGKESGVTWAQSKD